MHIQLIILTIFVSMCVWAQPAPTEVDQLFAKYDMIVQGEKSVKVSDVFTQKFITGMGGEKAVREGWGKMAKTKFEHKIKPSRNNKDMAYVQRVPAGSKIKPHSSFVLVKENGQWRIQGTLSDTE